MDNTETTNPGTADSTPGYVDTAELGLEMHLLIKDADSDAVLVNQRG